MAVLISSCLLGIGCRYDGSHSGVEEIIRKAQEMDLIPICPEQLGSLPTPRASSSIATGDGKGVLAGHAQVINSLALLLSAGIEVVEIDPEGKSRI